jgi:uncharacterized lipoprotein YddW (UPF0748 family)
MKLNCGRIQGYTVEAERQYLSAESGGGDIYNINVTFINKRPTDRVADKSLRDCLKEAIKLDDHKDILMNAWYRPVRGSNPNDDEMINPYGFLTNLIYSHSTKSISIHKAQPLQHK